MTANERRPAGAASEAPRPKSTVATSSDTTRRHTDDEVIAWYEAGVVHGIEMGRRQVEEEWRDTMEVSAAIARMIAGATPFAELCEQRGEPERAAAQRQLLRERGIAL